MFEQLVLVDHPNIVKLHKYWLDASEARARVSGGGRGRGAGGVRGHRRPQPVEPIPSARPQVVFITEYVSSGSLKQFLKKTKKNHKAMNARVWGAGCGQGGGGDGMGRDARGGGRRRGPGSQWGHHRPSPSPRPSDPRMRLPRPPPGLEALVHADPVGAQVRPGPPARAGPSRASCARPDPLRSPPAASCMPAAPPSFTGT